MTRRQRAGAGLLLLGTGLATGLFGGIGAVQSADAAPPGNAVVALASPSGADRTSAADAVSVTAGYAPAPSDGAATWVWPVTGGVVAPFAAPPTRYAAGHRGIDIRTDVGARVRSPAGGVVSFAGWVVDRPVLSIQHANGVVSSFEPVEASVSTGDVLASGDEVGSVVGSPASHCAESCLHVGARIDGEYVNPLLFLGELPWSVLLPLE